MRPIKNVLVVGGAGYIGGCVTDQLISHKIPFTVYDNLTYEHQYLKPVDFIYGDVRDTKKLAALLKKYSHVIWLAAIVGDGACAIKPELTKKINQDAVEWLAKNFNGRILFTSTCSVYGLSNMPVSETSETNPLSVYAQTKLAAESFLTSRNALIFRLGTAYGMGDAYSRIRMDLAINYMTMRGIKNGALEVYGGSQWRPFIHVKDIGFNLVNNLSSEHIGIYNMATQNATIIEIANKIKRYTKCKITITEQKFEDNRNYNADIRKGLSARVFSDKTEHIIDFGIKEIKDLVLSNRVKDLEMEFYSNQRYLLKSIAQYEMV